MTLSAGYTRGLDVLGTKDMETAFDVARVVNKTAGGLLSAVYGPGVGQGAEKLTELWLDPLQVELTKKPVPKKPLTDAEKKTAAEKAIADAQAMKVKADLNPSDVKLAEEAKVAAKKAVSLAADANIFPTPAGKDEKGAPAGSGVAAGAGTPTSAKKMIWPIVAGVGGGVGVLTILGLLLRSKR